MLNRTITHDAVSVFCADSIMGVISAMLISMILLNITFRILTTSRQAGREDPVPSPQAEP